MTSGLLMQQISELFLVMIMGYIISKKGLVKPEDSKVLSLIALYLVTPCVIINAFQVEYTDNVRDGLLLAFVSAIVVHIILLILISICNKIFNLRPEEKLSAMYSNAGNLIIPIVSAILGHQWVIYSSAFIIVQLILLWTHGRIVISGSKKIQWRDFLLNINLISILIGLLLFLCRIKLPTVINETLATVGNMIGPICMLTAGILFAGIDIKRLLKNKRIYLVTVLRLIIFPLIIMVILKFCGLSDFVQDGTTILLISFLATITPTAATVTQMTLVYGGDADNATGIYVITTLVAIVTMPILVMIYQM